MVSLHTVRKSNEDAPIFLVDHLNTVLAIYDHGEVIEKMEVPVQHHYKN